MAKYTDDRESAESLSIPEWVDQIADQYEAAWQGLKPPQIDDFLGDASGERRAALVEELLRIDRAYREQLSESNQILDASDHAAGARLSASDIAAPTPL